MQNFFTQIPDGSFFRRLIYWLWYDFFGIFKEMRLSYLPPLMVYLAAGISGFTGIVESFYVKNELGLSPEFLASLGFWAGLPWALKMPLGHLVDLFWRRKVVFVYLGATLMAVSLLIMVGLTGYRSFLEQFLAADTWYIIATLISPVGFMMQDVVADAMTVEAVPDYDEQGEPIEEKELQRMHVTMQTLGRIAIIGGSAMVAGIGGWLAQTLSYEIMYKIALIIPLISVAGVSLGSVTLRNRRLKLKQSGISERGIDVMLHQQEHTIKPNWYILAGSGGFIALSLILGLSSIGLKKEAIFTGSLLIIGFLIHQLLKDLSENKRREIIGIAVMVFVFRAMPGTGAGSSWWQIDVLGFDESFFGTLRQVSAILVILGLFGLRGWMSRRPLPYMIIFLSCYTTVMTMPYIGMYYGLHEWTQIHLGIGARTIAIIDTMADSPLGQASMVPMLAWIAKEAPNAQKATYFAIMAAFTNLALSASSLSTAYMNKIFVITRSDFSELGQLLMVVTAIGLLIPVTTVILVNRWIGGASPAQENTSR